MSQNCSGRSRPPYDSSGNDTNQNTTVACTTDTVVILLI